MKNRFQNIKPVVGDVVSGTLTSVGIVMKLTRTLVVVGLLTLGGTAANATTISWGSSWSTFSTSSYSSQVRSERIGGIASVLFHRYNTNQQFRQNVNRVAAITLVRVREHLAVPSRQDTGGHSSEVPLPASGLLLVGALGALALGRRWKS